MDEASLVSACSISPRSRAADSTGTRRSLVVRLRPVRAAHRVRTRLTPQPQIPFGTPPASPYSLSFSTEDFPPALAFLATATPSLTRAARQKWGCPPATSSAWTSACSRSPWRSFQQRRSGSYSYDPQPAGSTQPRVDQADLDPNGRSRPIRFQDEPLPAGTYLLILDSPDDEADARGMLLVVRSVELVMKTTLEESLIWAVDLASGDPIAGLPVRLLDENGAQIASATTDPRGVARAELASQTDPYSRTFAMAGGEAQGGLRPPPAPPGRSARQYEFGVNLYVAAPRPDRLPVHRPPHLPPRPHGARARHLAPGRAHWMRASRRVGCETHPARPDQVKWRQRGGRFRFWHLPRRVPLGPGGNARQLRHPIRLRLDIL
jgi:hypothetical protein